MTVYHLSKTQGQVSLMLPLLKGKIHFIPDQRFDHGDPYPGPATWTQDEEHLTVLLFCALAFLEIFLFTFSSNTSMLFSIKVPKQFQESFISLKIFPSPLVVTQLSLSMHSVSPAAMCKMLCKPGETLLKSADVVWVCSAFLE